jgi:hypothetical protein
MSREPKWRKRAGAPPAPVLPSPWLKEPRPEGMQYRVGDCRRVLRDIEDDSVAAIITDPPHKKSAEPLYVWLAEFAQRVLIKGGSLIIYSGHFDLGRNIRICTEAGLKEWCSLVMPLQPRRTMPGAFVIVEHRPVIWMVKGSRRRIDQQTYLPTSLRSVRNKDTHDWCTGTGGFDALVRHLTKPGELIIDPFAGVGQWGHVSSSMGRRWIGCDIEKGGSTRIEAGPLGEVTSDDDDGLDLPPSLRRPA